MENSLASWQTLLVSGVKFIGKESLPVSTPICVNAKVGIRTSSCQRQKAETQRNPQGAENGILNIPLIMRQQGQGKATLPLVLLEPFSALAALLQPSASKFIHKNPFFVITEFPNFLLFFYIMAENAIKKENSCEMHFPPLDKTIKVLLA